MQIHVIIPISAKKNNSLIYNRIMNLCYSELKSFYFMFSMEDKLHFVQIKSKYITLSKRSMNK